MDTAQKAKDLAKEIRETFTSGEIPPSAPTSRPGEYLSPTDAEIWDNVESILTPKIQRHLEDAYAVGKHDGRKEAKGHK